MPSPRIRLLLRVLASLIVAGSVLGVLPPAVGGGAPPTVVRMVALDEGRLLPRRAAATLTPRGGLRVGRAAWTPAARVCAPIRFTMLGLVWRQAGASEVETRLGWRPHGSPFGPAIEVHADPAEGPDAGSPDRRALAGTPPVWTGEASCARVRLRLPAGEALGGIRAAFVNTSGTPERPSLLERAGDILAAAWGMLAAEPAEAMTVQPPIITRAGWGANEKLRRCGPDYADSLKMAYVHHTVNSNSYRRHQADDLLRGIYAYHVKGRNFCDIAYNFLIDRFGRIYEGRYGGIDQPVIGAHAAGFNTASVGVAGLGTFTSTRPPRAMVRAYKRLLAWRLDVAHLRPTGTAVMQSAGGPTTKYKKGEIVKLRIISGHRDTGLTTCPGRRLYGKLAAIRRGAEARGLPKIWNVTQSASSISTSQQETVRFTATMSEPMSWTLEVADAVGAVQRSYTGSGTFLDVTWDGKAGGGLQAPTGAYTVTIRAEKPAGAVARQAVRSLTINP